MMREASAPTAAAHSSMLLGDAFKGALSGAPLRSLGSRLIRISWLLDVLGLGWGRGWGEGPKAFQRPKHSQGFVRLPVLIQTFAV